MADLEYAPIFIVGHPRSGTTWLTALLGDHPRLASGSETHLYNLYLRNMLTDREKWLGEWVEEDRLRELLKDLVSGIFQAALDKQGKVRVVEKTPTHRFWIKEILSMFPEAKFIHSVRDGRDVSLSLLNRRKKSKEKWIPGSLPGCARAWKESVTLLRSISAELGPERMTEIHFETIVNEPMEELGRLLRFLGEELPREEMKRLIDLHPPRAKNLEKWRRQLSSWQKRRFLKETGPLLAELGYPEK